MTAESRISEMYGLTTDDYTLLRMKIVSIHKKIGSTPDISQPEVYRQIEAVSTSIKEAIMITSGVCALSWGIL